MRTRVPSILVITDPKLSALGHWGIGCRCQTKQAIRPPTSLPAASAIITLGHPSLPLIIRRTTGRCHPCLKMLFCNKQSPLQVLTHANEQVASSSHDLLTSRLHHSSYAVFSENVLVTYETLLEDFVWSFALARYLV